MNDPELMKTARHAARNVVWRQVTDELAKDGRAVRAGPGRFTAGYLKLICGISLGVATGVFGTAAVYFITVFILHLDMPDWLHGPW